MADYDVVVVGAGPAGSLAAKATVERGVSTLLIEEDAQIGQPEHCHGRIVGTKSGFLERLIATMDKRVVVTKMKARRIYSPKGRMVEIPLEGKGAKIIERNLFDLECGRQAADAGAEIMLNTRVTGLIKEDGIIKGVKTNSRTNPEIRSKVVIAADGIHAPLNGIPVWEGWEKKAANISISLYLTGVKDIEFGVSEMHLGEWDITSDVKINWVLLDPRSSTTCLVNARNLESFERVKAGNWALSRKIRDSRILRFWGWMQTQTSGRGGYPKKVKDGLILTGAAADYQGIDSAVFSGPLAGQVATEAIQEGDFSEKKLRKYEDLCKPLNYPRGRYMSLFHRLSEEEMEKMWDEEIAQAREFACNDVIPI